MSLLKLSSAYIQAIGLLVMLAELPQGQSLKSSEISQRMEVSPSYLVKIATKLRKAQLIESQASKQGGYKIKKALETITFLDIFEAIEGAEPFLSGVDLHPIHAMFINQQLVKEKSTDVVHLHQAAEMVYRQHLRQQLLVNILPRDEKGDYLIIDWRKHINE